MTEERAPSYHQPKPKLKSREQELLPRLFWLKKKNRIIKPIQDSPHEARKRGGSARISYKFSLKKMKKREFSAPSAMAGRNLGKSRAA